MNNRKTFLFILILILLFFSVLGEDFNILLQYERSLIFNGEYLRILTGHLSHTGWNHLFLNLIGILLVSNIFGSLYSTSFWLVGIVSCMLGISFSLLLFSPELQWYRGFSGVLHGLIVMGVIGEIKKGHKIYYIGLLAVIGKLVVEQSIWPSIHTDQFINAPIIISAHYYGAVTGAVTSCFLFLIEEVSPIRDTQMRWGKKVFRKTALSVSGKNIEENKEITLRRLRKL